MQIQFEKTNGIVCVTPCPNRMLSGHVVYEKEDGALGGDKPVMVGSSMCKKCTYHGGITGNIVNCLHK